MKILTCCIFQEQIDNELVPYKLPDGSVIQVRQALPICYGLSCSSTVVSQPWALSITSDFSPFLGYRYCTHLCGSCYSNPLKCSMWDLPRDSTVHVLLLYTLINSIVDCHRLVEQGSVLPSFSSIRFSLVKRVREFIR